MLEQFPLISCICITKNAPDLLQKAINCFLGQSYPNKEMIIIAEKQISLSEDFLLNVVNSNINVLFVDNINSEYKLGYLRNLGIQAAKGEFVIQWDDDDWYHKDRIMYQFLEKNEQRTIANVLTRWIVFNSRSQQAYISNKRLWEGSLLCEKVFFRKNKYENKSLGEDTPIVTKLYLTNNLSQSNGIPYLYIYRFHGENAWDIDHWNSLFSVCDFCLDADISETIGYLFKKEIDVLEGSELLENILIKKGLVHEE